ncbi:AraC family transcriptional regulator [Micromonospora sp. NBS 11-29]|uniref:AraC family transcriptional regulator n=1 Tax=Micromonospora sp. NBS 11-29 TaxID=1960879 RepID=UPI000B7957DD|nr:AraC family transcriptional regulator [Micromonospora sp. NBS 11-29]
MSGPGTSLATSDGLGWRTVSASLCADPAQLREFVAPAGPDLTMVLVVAGRYTIESRAGAARYRPGSVAVNAPGRESVFRWHSTGTQTLRSFHLRFPSAVLHQTLDDLAMAHGDLERLDALSLADPYLSSSLFALHRALGAGAAGLYADTVAGALLTHLVHTGLRVRPDQGGTGVDAGPLSRRELARVVDYMHANLGANIQLDELAAVANVSKFHFLRMFARSTGLTPYRYLTRERMRHGAGLLRGSELSVQQIAVACGYASASRFSAAFRRQYGITPAAYRN